MADGGDELDFVYDLVHAIGVTAPDPFDGDDLVVGDFSDVHRSIGAGAEPVSVGEVICCALDVSVGVDGDGATCFRQQAFVGLSVLGGDATTVEEVAEESKAKH